MNDRASHGSREAESRGGDEHLVGCDERGVDVESARRDPEVIPVNSVRKRVAGKPALEAKARDSGQQPIADRDHGGRLDGPFEPEPASGPPVGDQRAVPEFGDGLRRRETAGSRRATRPEVPCLGGRVH